MRIMVTNEYGETIYEDIDAEDFLYENNGDSILEEKLSQLEYKKTGSEEYFEGDNENYILTKLKDENIFEDYSN